MLRMLRRILVFALLFSISALAKDKAKIQKQTVQFAGIERTYYLFVPDTVPASAPLLLMLHGSGRTGRIMVEMWKDLAATEGIVLVAPDARDTQEWSNDDGPPFLHAVIDAVRAAQPIDMMRVYLFGHSAGASMALMVSLMDSQYFAAAAVHAGALPAEASHFPDADRRKTPIKIFVGDSDPFFP